MSIKTLITADDFGFTSNINRAIREAYEKSRVTELSLMVDSYGTDEAVKYVRDNNVQNVGLHFSLLRVSKGIKIYGTPKEMYNQYKKDIQEAKQKHEFKSAEFIFHPGYTGEFEKGLTSFIQERIDDKEEKLQLVTSSEI